MTHLCNCFHYHFEDKREIDHDQMAVTDAGYEFMEAIWDNLAPAVKALDDAPKPKAADTYANKASSRRAAKCILGHDNFTLDQNTDGR